MTFNGSNVSFQNYLIKYIFNKLNEFEYKVITGVGLYQIC